MDIWNLVINALVALGTLGAVVVALFGEWFTARWFSPKFQIDILKPGGEPCPITDAAGNHINDGRYYHLKVRNKRVWPPATHSQLRLIRVETRGPNDQLQITWDGDIPIRRRHQEFYPTEAEIGSAVDYDLCAIVRSPAPVLSLMPIVPANNLPTQWTGNSHFVCSFQPKCSQRDSEVVRIQFDWDGTWHDGDAEIQKHFHIQPVTSSN
jgi:hypothetical protein